MELETVNKLYLELSQFATAKTKNDLELEKITERSRRRGKLLADIFNHEDVNLPLELMNRIDAEVMGHNVEHNRRPQGVRVDGPVGPHSESEE